MEKFSTWRDPATGIAPFLPATKPMSEVATQTIFSVFGSFLTALISLPWTVFSLVLYIAVFQFVPDPVRSLYVRYNLLLSLRVWSIDVGFENSSGQSAGSNKGRRDTRSLPEGGDLIVSNFTSPLDILTYSVLSRPLFVVPAEQGQFLTVSVLGAILEALSLPTSDVRIGKSLAEICKGAKKSGHTVVLFAEGTTTSGRALLPFPNQIPVSLLPYTTKVFPTSVKYSPQSVTTPLPTSLLGWLYSHLSEWHRVSIRVKFVSPLTSSDVSSSNDHATTNSIAESIARSGRIARMGQDFDSGSKRRFAASWKKGRLRRLAESD